MILKRRFGDPVSGNDATVQLFTKQPSVDMARTEKFVTSANNKTNRAYPPVTVYARPAFAVCRE